MALDSQDHSYLHVGDIVSLYTEGAITGFLSSLGIVDDRVIVEPDDGYNEDIPKKFRDCLFELCPVNRYSSQKELWKYEKRLTSGVSRDTDSAASMLKALRIAAQKERDQNDHEAVVRRGKVLQYGETIQLRHFKSRKFLTVNRNEAAKEERTAFRVYLDNEGNEGSVFFIEPFLKIRAIGDRLVVGDKAMLVPSVGATRIGSGSTGKNQIHVSQHSIRDFPASSFKEVNCLNERTCWKVNLFLTYDENQPKILKGGDVLRLFHAEKQMYLTLDYHNHVPTVYLRKTDRGDTRMALNPKALWEVEVVQQNSVRGARGRWSDLYRFKHLATDMYLVAELDTDEQPERTPPKVESVGSLPKPALNGIHNRRFKLIAVPSCANEKSSLFQLDPTTVIGSSDEFVPESAYIRLRHFFTGTWVTSTDTRYDGKSMFKVGCTHSREDKEAFYVVPVPAAEVRDLDFANDSARSLQRFHSGLAGITKESFGLRSINTMKNLLGELIIFLCYRNLDNIYSYGISDLIAMKPKKKERSRQKMLREQDVLQHVQGLLQWAVDQQVLWLNDDKNVENFRTIFRLCHHIIKLCIIGYRKNQEFIAKKFKLLQDQIGLGVGAEDTITTLMNLNPDLKVCIKETNIDEFVSLVRKHRQAKYLDYLAILCASKGLPIAEIQDQICRTVMAEDNLDTLIYTHDEYHPLTKEFFPGAVFLAWNQKGHEPVVRELHDLANSDEESDVIMLEFYQHQLDLFSNMCLGRSFLAIGNPFFQNQLSVELILRCISDEKLHSYPLRASFAKLMLHLHVDKDPQDKVEAIHHARLWQEIPDSMSSCAQEGDSDLLERAEESDDKRISAREAFQPTISFVVCYLNSIKKDGFRDRKKNIFSQNVIVLAKYMVHFGFYKLEDLMKLTKVLLNILDCMDCAETAAGKQQRRASPMVASAMFKSIQKIGWAGVTNAHMFGKGQGSELSETDETVLNAKLTIVDILQFMLNVRLDHRVTCMLALFKEKYTNDAFEPTRTSISEEPDSPTSTKSDGQTIAISQEETMEIARSLLAAENSLAATQSPMRMSIDDDSGRQLLRILLYLIMHNYPPLISGALGLLFRHFSQLQELVHTFREVQLLVSQEDIDNYKLIKTHLTTLKTLIDKSELWVNKKERKMTGAGQDEPPQGDHTPKVVQSTDNEFDVCTLPMVARSVKDDKNDPLKDPFETFGNILNDLCRLCFKEFEGDNKQKPLPNKTNQQLLRNMKVHESILIFLGVPVEHMSQSMLQLFSKSHEFLRRFSLGNKESQQLLAQHVQYAHSFNASKALKLETAEDVETLNAIYKDNRDLCANVSEDLVSHVVSLLDRSERNPVFITFLQTIVKAGATSIPRTQSLVMEELSNASDELLLLYNDKHTFGELEDLMRRANSGTVSNDLLYHIGLVKLLSTCTEEKNGDTELKAANLLTINDILRVLESPHSSYLMKSTYVNFLYHCFIDTDVEIIKEAYNLSRVWKCFEVIEEDMKQVRVCGPDGSESLITYIISSCVDQLLCKFFAKMNVDDNMWNELLQPHYGTLRKLHLGLLDLEVCSWLSKNQLERIGTCKSRIMQVARRNDIRLPVRAAEGSRDEDATCKIDPVVPEALANVATGKKFAQLLMNRRKPRKNLPRSSTDFRSIVDQLSDLLACLEANVEPLAEAEFSILVDVLHRPHILFPVDSECDRFCKAGKFLEKLIQHTHELFKENQDNQVIRILGTFRKMIRSPVERQIDGNSREIKELVFNRYLSQDVVVQKKETQSFASLVSLVSTVVTQNDMDKAGASSLVVDIVMKNPKHRILTECIELGMALLDGGNSQVQKAFYERFQSPDTAEKFFQVLADRIKTAETNLKSSVSANPLDLVGKKSSPCSTPTRRGSLGGAYPPFFQPGRRPSTENSPDSPDSLARLNSVPGDADVLSVPPRADMDPNLSLCRDHQQPVVGREFKTPELTIITPIFRFLQLLCENHNRDLQNFLRDQHSKSNYDMISATLSFLDILCGSTTGSLGLLGMYINSHNVELLTQTLNTLTEYCQGPCHANQNAIASHESNGLDVIISLVLKNITPLGNTPEGLAMVLDIKSDSSKLLLAIMESRHDCENADRIISNMHRMESGPVQLIQAISDAYKQSANARKTAISVNVSDDDGVVSEEIFDGDGANPLEVGHNIYILAHQLGRHNKDLQAALAKPGAECQPAVKYYQERTGEIEIVREDLTMEKIVFPIADVCMHLTDETKYKVFTNAEKDNQGSKVEDFFSLRDDLYLEMQWQEKLKENERLSQVSRMSKIWSRLSVLLTLIINVVILRFYPFDRNDEVAQGLPGFLVSLLLCVGISAGLILSKTVPRHYAPHSFGICVVFRLLFAFYFRQTLWVLEAMLVLLKTAHIVAYVANHGSHRSPNRAVRDIELIQLVTGLAFAVLGTFQVLFFAMLLLDVALREETLQNVISSVTRNIRSILLTAMLAVILVVLFAIAGHLWFPNDFVTEAPETQETGPELPADTCAHSNFQPIEESDGDNMVPACHKLWGCFIMSISCGLRSGGGIGDCLRSRGPHEELFLSRQVYDLLFFSLIILIVLNLIFGVIIDQFGDLRNERRERADTLQNTCFICGLHRSSFDNKSVTFKEHTQREHFLWNYLYFMVLLLTKERTEFTGPESYVYKMMNDPQRGLEWFPKLRAMSLAEEEASDPEQNEMKLNN